MQRQKYWLIIPFLTSIPSSLWHVRALSLCAGYVYCLYKMEGFKKTSNVCRSRKLSGFAQR